MKQHGVADTAQCRRMDSANVVGGCTSLSGWKLAVRDLSADPRQRNCLYPLNWWMTEGLIG
eukprot:758941-Hanusia_phi.AAC.1